ncbi:MAG: prephenate dehydratase [Bacteroidia bacterium]
MNNDLRTIRVAIQGSPASFHHGAARKYFGSAVEILSCPTFRESCDALANNLADYTVIAAGNSIAGNILTNYELVLKHKFSVIGELFTPVALHLMALRETDPEEIRYIRSHPMALLQCGNFLISNTEVEVIAAGDTAACAKDVCERKLTDTAVIAGYEAATYYGLHILNENIHSESSNYTRFWILSKGETIPDETNKATISFELRDKTGSLADALFCFRSQALNLVSIQSLPVKGERYRFYADVEYAHRKKFLRCLDALQLKSSDLKVMGEYRKDNNPNLETFHI